MTRSQGKYFIFMWLLGIPFSYVTLGFWSNYYTSAIGMFLLTVLVHSLMTLFVCYLFARVGRDIKSNPLDSSISIILFAAVAVFFAALVKMAGNFPNLFDVSFFLPDSVVLLYLIVGLAVAYPVSAWVLPRAGQMDLGTNRILSFIDSHLGGLLLTASFFSVYFLLATIFNQPAIFKFDDIFFDTDSELWRWRFATERYEDYYERIVHPFVLIIVRPFVWIISILIKGDTLYASFILTAVTGALCVFLVWYFVKTMTCNSVYALLIATLFGISTSQLIFGSLIETYGYLCAVALIFVVLVLKDKPLYAQVIAGLAAFGITVTNIAQTFIVHLFVKRDIKQIIKYGLIVGALVIPLNLLNNFIYPNAHPYLWDVSTLQYEAKNAFPINFQRANYLGRVMTLHSIVAPQPLLLKEDIPFLKVWMFRASMKKVPMQIARYENLFDTSVAFLWVGFMLLGVVLFLKNFLKQDNRFSIAFIVTILFYFALHLRYGRDVFLYSSNWTYAIILTLALAWREISEKKRFQIPLLVFIVLLMINNSRLILYMLTASYLHVR